MRDRKKYRQTLGITQLDVALLIGTTKSNFSMYEIGQRELTSQQLLELVKMQDYVLKREEAKADGELILQEREQITEILKSELKKIEFEKLTLERLLDKTHSKYQKALSALMLIGYLETNDSHKNTHQVIANKIKVMAEKSVKRHGPSKSISLEIRLKTLNYQIELIEQEMKLYVKS